MLLRVVFVSTGVLWMWGLIMAWAVWTDSRVRGGGWIGCCGDILMVEIRIRFLVVLCLTVVWEVR